MITDKGWSSDFTPLPSAFSKNVQWRRCLGAITELTAAGQSGIYTSFPIKHS